VLSIFSSGRGAWCAAGRKKANIQELQISCYISGAERYIFVTENDRPSPWSGRKNPTYGFRF